MSERRSHWDDDLIDAVRDAVDIEFDGVWRLTEDSILAVIAAVEDWARSAPWKEAAMAERIVPACPAGHIDTPFMVEVRGVYDGGLIFECPVCQARWPRFAEGRLHRAALKIIEEWGTS